MIIAQCVNLSRWHSNSTLQVTQPWRTLREGSPAHSLWLWTYHLLSVGPIFSQLEHQGMGQCPLNIFSILYTCDRLEGKVFLASGKGFLIYQSWSSVAMSRSDILVGTCVSDIKTKDVRADNCPSIILPQKTGHVPQHSYMCSYHPLCFHFCNPFLNLWNLLSFSLIIILFTLFLGLLF